MNALLQLGLVYVDNLTIRLIPVFQTDWKRLLTESYSNRKAADPILGQFAGEQWEKVLYHIADHDNNPLPERLAAVILQLGLIENEELSDLGIQFLLKDTRLQLWIFLTAYIEKWASEAAEELLCLLAELGFQPTGQYRGVGEQQALLQDLQEVGLVKIEGDQYTSTPSAQSLFTDEETTSGKQQAQIIVETNFRLYTYTTAELVFALIKFFTSVEYRLPGLIVSQLTFESVQQGVTRFGLPDAQWCNCI